MKQACFVLGVAICFLVRGSGCFECMGNDWTITVSNDLQTMSFAIDPVPVVEVKNELYGSLMAYDPADLNPKNPWNRPLNSAGWCRGTALTGVSAMECTVRHALEPHTVRVTLVDGTPLDKDRDYVLTGDWGTIARTLTGRIASNTAVRISYSYRQQRIDRIVVKDGQISLKRGTPHVSVPMPPLIEPGEQTLATVHVDAQTRSLTNANIYYIKEESYREPLADAAAKTVPRTLAKLMNGETVRILAWGDSVTHGGFLPPYDRWHAQFIRRLKIKFPKADIRLEVVGWPGRTTSSFLSAPVDSQWNFNRRIKASSADLVISEFVNDGGWSEKATRDTYGRIAEAFRETGKEWIILTPHYVRPDWMGLKSVCDCDEDPRVYVKTLRAFALENGLGLADASKRWGRLYRRGIPYTTLLLNAINHPTAFGCGLYADALMDFFGGDEPNAWALFSNPPMSAKPWTYYFWSNSLTDRETISAEVADIARLGFGGILLTDSRGYWDDDDHVRNPPAAIRWGSEAWLDLIEHTVREAGRHGLSFVLNVAASGGHLRGDMDVGDDAPKFLKCRSYLPGDVFERPSFPNVRDVAVFAVRTAEQSERTDWADAGDGQISMEGNSCKGGSRNVFKRRTALEVRELKTPEDGRNLGANWTILRFVCATVPGHERDVDVLDCEAVKRHLDRVVTPLITRLPGLVGKDKTFAGLYNVSWEGLMPTWSKTFEVDFAADAGYALRPKLPLLAGFVPSGMNAEEMMRAYRRARGRMMARHLYATVREWAHAHGMFATAESGGPWGWNQKRDPRTFGECDQFEFLAANDVPQGEFWPQMENATHPDAGRANRNIRLFGRGIVEAAHRAKLPIAAVEAFTHMNRHWTVDPAFLKPLADAAFVDGLNRIVWHTYTTSPAKYGVPGFEYFAGSHINRNVTWNRDAVPFIHYLWRCQALLQAGDWVDDGEFLPPEDNYYSFGRYRVNEGAQFLTTHRRIGTADVFFVTGEGMGNVTLNASRDGRAVEVWNPVDVTWSTADFEEIEERTKVRLDLPRGGSAFVVFACPDDSARSCVPYSHPVSESDVAGPWHVTFRYHSGVTATPPRTQTMDQLVDWTTTGELRHFSGTGSYRTTFDLTSLTKYRIVLSLGAVPTGLAHVFVNSTDCGVVWCAPWSVDITRAVKTGRNELQIEYTNNWHNRLVGDCALPPKLRVTHSVLRYWDKPRTGTASWNMRPTVYSGPSAYDPLQSSGLLGPIRLLFFSQ